jgi:hypothetical protein
MGDNAKIADVFNHGFHATHPGERFSSGHWTEFSGESPKELDRVSSLEEKPGWVSKTFYHRPARISSFFPPAGETLGDFFPYPFL